MIRIGVTGGIGSGKSTVCRVFEALGAAVYNSDRAARELMNSDPVLVAKIKQLFGECAYAGGELDRAYVGSVVFSDPAKLLALNNLVHPSVGDDFVCWAGGQSDARYVIIESAILFESGFDHYTDKNVLVYAPEELRVARVVCRDGVSEARVRDRIAAQGDQEELRRRADWTIVCDDVELVVPQVVAVHEKILEL